MEQLHNRLSERDYYNQQIKTDTGIDKFESYKNDKYYVYNRYTFKCNEKDGVCAINDSNQLIPFVIKDFHVNEYGTRFIRGIIGI